MRDLLKKCLESILRYEHGVDYEIIVVDNGSWDGTQEMLKNIKYPPSPRLRRTSQTPKIRIISNDKNLGFAKANNQGIKEAKGEYVLLLNPDTEFIEDALSKCVAKMESDEKIGVLGCQLLNPDRTIQHSVRAFPRARDILVMFLKLHKLFPSLLDRYLAKDFFKKFSSSGPSPLRRQGYGGQAYPLPGRERGLYEVDQVMGAFFLVRRKVFDEIGLLDEKFFIWFEEVDFCRRARNNGWKVVYYPYAWIIHHQGQSFAQTSSLKKQMWFFKSALRYFTKGD